MQMAREDWLSAERDGPFSEPLETEVCAVAVVPTDVVDVPGEGKADLEPVDRVLGRRDSSATGFGRGGEGGGPGRLVGSCMNMTCVKIRARL